MVHSARFWPGVKCVLQRAQSLFDLTGSGHGWTLRPAAQARVCALHCSRLAKQGSAGNARRSGPAAHVRCPACTGHQQAWSHAAQAP